MAFSCSQQRGLSREQEIIRTEEKEGYRRMVLKYVHFFNVGTNGPRKRSIFFFSFFSSVYYHHCLLVYETFESHLRQKLAASSRQKQN